MASLPLKRLCILIPITLRDKPIYRDCDLDGKHKGPAGGCWKRLGTEQIAQSISLGALRNLGMMRLSKVAY